MPYLRVQDNLPGQARTRAAPSGVERTNQGPPRLSQRQVWQEKLDAELETTQKNIILEERSRSNSEIDEICWLDDIR